MTKPFPPKFALVTGASSGIGTEFARQLAKKGHHLILVARRRERLEALAKELTNAHKVEVHVLPADLGTSKGAEMLFQTVVQSNWDVDILINNAGVGMQGELLEMDLAEMEAMFTLNIHSLTTLTMLFGKQMAERGSGRILQVASMTAFIPSPYLSAYAATKAYVGAFSDAARFELKPKGVVLTTLYPGITTTEFNEVAHAKTPKMMDASILSAEKVAQIGLRGMFAGKRQVIPGFINNMNAFFSNILPRGFMINSAGQLMGKANGW